MRGLVEIWADHLVFNFLFLWGTGHDQVTISELQFLITKMWMETVAHSTGMK